MLKNIPSASDTALPDRRLFLAAGSATALFAAVAKTSAADHSPLVALIETNRAARQAFCEAVDIEQEAERTGLNVEAADALWQEKNDAERASAIDLLSYSCRTIEEVRIKAEYILSSPLKDEIHDSDLLKPFLRSLTGATTEA
jgi:hypothetical protein